MSTKNKVHFNLKNVHIAILTKNADGTFTYDTPVALPGAVSMNMEAQGDSSAMYADGIVWYRSVSNNGYSGDLEIAIISDWFRKNILKEIKDVNGVYVERSDSNDPVYFAMLFEFEGDMHAIRHVFYNCTVSARPTVESSTKEENIEPGTETLSITADPREDGLVKARSGDDTTDEVYQNWYKSVYVPGDVADDEAAELSALSIGSSVLIPNFATGTKTYAVGTSNASDEITATGADGATVAITVNGTVHTSGTAATWETGANTVKITVSKSGSTTSVYTVTVTKAAG